MIPLGDEGAQQGRGLPIVNLTLIALNILFFIFQQVGGDPINYGWSLIPKEITTGQDLIGPTPVPGTNDVIPLYPAPFGIVYLTLLTSMFMHGGLLHIASNMLFLFIFGDNVEANFGPLKYLFFYLVCGFAADFAQIIMGGADSVIPNLGASGAIAGVLGAYIVLFPQARIRTLVFLGFYGTITYVPALIMIGLWIAIQLISVVGLQEATGGGGVAFWAHIGGFAAGLILTFFLRSRTTTSPIYSR
jgi:rhomboid family protein